MLGARFVRFDLFYDQLIYELGDGRLCAFGASDVRRYGLEELLQSMDIQLSSERMPVFQRGKRIGSLPAIFNPVAWRVTSPFVDLRDGDFRLDADGWHAAKTLCPGDLEAVEGFVWERNKCS